LPQTNELPAAYRRLDEVCAPGYTGRKRGQVVRTRTVISQAHTFQWLGSFGNRGNGRYREELCKALSAISRYLSAHQIPIARALLRLDGQYGTGSVLSDLAGFTFVTRGKDYTVLDYRLIQARLYLPPDQYQQRPESQVVRSLYDCPDIPVGPQAQRCRVIIASHPAGTTEHQVGVERDGTVYELFFTNLPQSAFTAHDVVELYLHRGAFEPILSDEDQEQESDRWCSHAACGQECWQVISQWVWNLRLELGHRLQPTPVRTTEFVPALTPPSAPSPHAAPAAGYAPPQVGSPWKAGRFSGQDFTLQPDGTLRCPADQPLVAHERRTEADGSLRVVFGASLHSCRPCPLRAQCQWQGSATQKPRQVSLLLHPLAVGPQPLLWRDWSRRAHRRAVRQLLRQQHLEVRLLAQPTGCATRFTSSEFGLRAPFAGLLFSSGRCMSEPLSEKHENIQWLHGAISDTCASRCATRGRCGSLSFFLGPNERRVPSTVEAIVSPHRCSLARFAANSGSYFGPATTSQPKAKDKVPYLKLPS
jgi:hypothetical protein